MAIIGIDLGTTYSLVTTYKNGECIFIPNQFGDILTPSVVSIEKGNIIVGKIAKERLVTHHQNTVSAFKTFMGSEKIYTIDRKKYTPIDLSSMVIKQLVEDAKKYLQEDIEEAVISVPAYFNDAKRLATKQAGELAGVKVQRIINEPSAAALASRIDRTDFETLLIFDLGGGTLDVSVVDCFDNVVEIVAVSGDNHLGGEDFNHVIKKYFIETYGLEKITLKEEAILLRNIEEMKKELVKFEEVKREIYINERNILFVLSRNILLDISDELLFKIKKVIEHALNDANLSITDIDRVIMVGGSSRLTVVQEYIYYLFHKEPVVSPQVDYLVGLGCGYVAGIKARNKDIKDKVLTDICPFSLGVGVYNPAGKKSIFSVIIERNATLPCSMKEYYTTVHDYQTEIEVCIYQGEEFFAENNHLIGKMKVVVPPNKAREEQIEVCFTYDINGILNVEIISLSNHTKIHKTFVSEECILSQEDIEKRIKELENLTSRSEDDSELAYLMERAYRIYEESIGSKRKEAEIILYKLEELKNINKLGYIEKEKKVIQVKLDNLELQSPFKFEEKDILN